MTFKKATPFVPEVVNVVVEPVETPSTISTTVKKIVHKSIFDYYGVDDFSNVLMSNPVKERIQKYFYERNNHKEYSIFALISKFKWRKILSEEDKQNEKDFWYCNITFARNLFYMIFEGKIYSNAYDNHMEAYVTSASFLNPRKFVNSQVINLFEDLQKNILELQCWHPYGDNSIL